MLRQHLVRPLLLLALLALAGCAPLRADTRSLFATLTYADQPPRPPPHLALQLYAALELEGVTSYVSPRDAASCYRALSPALLRETGAELSLAEAVDPSQTWGRVERGLAAKLPAQCAAALASDGELLAYSVAHMAGTLWFFARATGAAPAGADAVYAAAPEAISRVARLLEATPASDSSAPVLALSGGSANGAFVAGFLFELLWARERALLEATDAAEKDTFERGSRFSGLVGTSVGALLSQLLDFYAVAPDAPLTDGQRRSLDSCLAYRAAPLDPGALSDNPSGCFEGYPGRDFPGFEPGVLAARPIQACALTQLHRYFTDVDEHDLMCIEPGAITRAVGYLGKPTLGLVRFDPMSLGILDPLLRDFSDLLLANGTTRIVVSVDMQQNQTLGLDERSCAALPSAPGTPGSVVAQGGREYCLGSGVMASVVLPFFASPVRHTYSGLADGGECSTWIDGGLRSGFPALRALRLARPQALTPPEGGRLRVLALETGRLNGLPAPRPSTILDVSLNAIGQMADANTVDELVLAQLASTQREREFAAMRAPPAAAPATPALPRAPGLRIAVPASATDDWSVSAVYVPSEVPSGLIADSGYAFDRYVMRGLFTWGRRAAMRRIVGEDPDGTINLNRRLPVQLGWPSRLASLVEAHVKADAADAELGRWQEAFALSECADFRSRRLAAGRARITAGSASDCLDVRVPAPATPRYFVCPATGLDLGAAEVRP